MEIKNGIIHNDNVIKKRIICVNNRNYVRQDFHNRELMKRRKKRLIRNRLIILQTIVFVIVASTVFSLIFIPGNSSLVDMQLPVSASLEKDEGVLTSTRADYAFLVKQIDDEISSTNAILIDLKSGEIMAEKAPDEKIFPASITKIMTALIALEHFQDTEISLEVSNLIFSYLIEQNASVAGFSAGEKVRVIDLLYGVLLPSGADACLTLANAIAGNEQAFAKKMTERARELGANNTNFTNSTGLHDNNHYTTVRDLSIILKYALKNDTFKTIFTTDKYTTASTNKHSDGLTFSNTTFTAFKRAGISNDYVLGGKTGYTGEAALCLATLARKNEREYILVTVGASTPNASRGTNHVVDANYIYKNFA